MLGDGYNERSMIVIIRDGLIATDWLLYMHVTLKRKKEKEKIAERKKYVTMLYIFWNTSI